MLLFLADKARVNLAAATTSGPTKTGFAPHRQVRPAYRRSLLDTATCAEL